MPAAAAVRMVPSKPALVVESGADGRRHLVVADLHIGFESRLAANGVFVGKNSTVGQTIDDISGIMRDEGARSLILLGDVKSGTGSITGSEWRDVPRFFEEVGREADITLIPGNHDANIRRLIPGNAVTMTGPSGMVLENTLLTHGHAMPSENFAHAERVVMGHVHPVFFDEGSVLNGQRVWVSARVRRQDLFPSSRGSMELLVVPSFNRYLYTTHRQKRRRSISPIIQRVSAFESARIVTMDGSIIGDESSLRMVI